MNPIITSPPGQPGPITDALDFFATLTENYLKLQKLAILINDNIDQNQNYNLIVRQCAELSNQRARLVAMDEEMFRILELAGEELTGTPLLHNYQLAFAQASFACNNLYQGLQALRLRFVEQSQKPQPA